MAGYAPVVLIGTAEHEAELSTLLAAGVAEFVARAEKCTEAVADVVEKRLQQRRSEAQAREHWAEAGCACAKTVDTESEEADFGALLRHELNNPLTGILGNAELLLVELRRKNGALPASAQQRLETIALPAVRMRETVRKLSDLWKAHAALFVHDETPRVN